MNSKELTTIDKIQEIKKKREELFLLEQDLLKTRLTDYKVIADIHSMMTEECKETDIIKWRKMFIFIIVLFFCPNVLMGKRLPKGLRIELKKYIKGISSCAISYYVNGLFLNYRLYKDFRIEAERLYTLFKIRLNL